MKQVWILGLLLSACSANKVMDSNKQPQASAVIHGKMFTTLYQQKAAEYRALCFQAYNMARLRLDQYKPHSQKPWAIITDLDETVLDNSPYAAKESLRGNDYAPASWAEWVGMASADTLPGSVSFLKYAASKGVEIFYISNRDEKFSAATIANLMKYNLPNTDKAHVLLRQQVSAKEERRQSVLSGHEIVMLLGDNLEDFSSLFDRKNETERYRNTDVSAVDFGNRFIVLPNPVYGDWEKAVYKYNKYTFQQKDSIIRSVLKAY